MSFSYIHCILPVSDGRRVRTVRSNGTSVWHALYDTTIYTETKTAISGTFRIFAPASMSNLSSNSLVIVHGKIAFPVGSDDCDKFIIDGLRMEPFVADPDEDGYDSFLPTESIPFIHILGQVSGTVIHLGDGGRAVDIKVGVYIQNQTVNCMFR